jgi:hypothetical protein
MIIAQIAVVLGGWSTIPAVLLFMQTTNLSGPWRVVGIRKAKAWVSHPATADPSAAREDDSGCDGTEFTPIIADP